MAAVARVTGGRSWRAGSMPCVHQPQPAEQLVLAFPSDADAAGFDEALAWADDHAVPTVACWQRAATPPGLAARLTAASFQEGWEPHWMAAHAGDVARHGADGDVAAITEVPEFDPYGQALLGLARAPAGDTAILVARDDDRLAGFAWVHAAGGVAGLYDMHVMRPLRRRGIGTRLTVAAGLHALALGCTTLTLNATEEGEHLYRRVGFGSLGRGTTWWRFRERLTPGG